MRTSGKSSGEEPASPGRQGNRSLLAVGVASLLAALLMMTLQDAAGLPILVAPASAILLGALLVDRARRQWAALAVLGFAATGLGYLLGGSSLVASTLLAGVDVVEAALGALVLLRLPIGRPPTGSVGEVGLFAAAALAIPVLPTALLFAGSFWTTAPDIGALALVHLYLARVVGLLVVVPLVMGRDAGPAGFPFRRAADAGLAAAALLAVAGVAVAAPSYLPLCFLAVMPLAVLLTSRAGLPAGAMLAAALALVMLAGFALARAGGQLADPWQVAAAFQGCLAATVLVTLVAAVAHAREQALSAALHDARAAVAQAERSKINFLSAMSHELRTPITAILGMSDLLKQAALPAAESGYLDTIRTSGQHLLVMVNDLLDFSRSEAGRLRLDSLDFSVVDVVEQTRSFLTPQAEELGLELHFTVQGDLPRVVRGDPRRLRQVLLNIVGNGLKFTNRGSVSVQVHHRLVSESAICLRVEVRDTGIGMTPEKMAKLFQAFDVEGTAIKRSHGGLGLGLALSDRLVRAMGGRLGIESTYRAGTLVWFEVTLELGSEARTAVTFDASKLRAIKVLVVDDGAVNRKLLSQMLTRHGHQVTAVRDGVEAVEMMVRGSFDAVLMDVQMPVMDGIQATKLIRDLAAPAGTTPIIGLTASIMPEEYKSCLDAGMNAVLAKPVDWEQLYQALHELSAEDEQPQGDRHPLGNDSHP